MGGHKGRSPRDLYPAEGAISGHFNYISHVSISGYCCCVMLLLVQSRRAYRLGLNLKIVPRGSTKLFC